MMNSHPTSHCGCCGSVRQTETGGWNRRTFLGAMGMAAGTVALSPFILEAMAQTDTEDVRPIRKPLRIQPVLVYETPRRREATSWRSWGSIQTDQDALREKHRIERELDEIRRRADYPIEFLPVALCKTVEQAKAIAAQNHDGVLDYAAGGWVPIHETLADPKKWNIMFVRHRSGPIYLWYEIAHNRFLRKTVDEFGQPGMDVEDVVVDDLDELVWRYRALSGLKNTLGKRIVAVGGPSGWGRGGREAPKHAREIWKMDLVTVSYKELGRMIEASYKDEKLQRKARLQAEKYLSDPTIRLETRKEFVERAFILTELFKRLLKAAHTDAITINLCMGTIIQMSRTTACLPLSLLNDAGLMAFCESDFVVIPAGVLLHYISGKPVFLNDPTYPHNGIVTQAHCTAPRKMDGQHPEPTRILTHFESDYGAAPKVEMRVGQEITDLVPDFSGRHWCGFRGKIVDHPFYDICRSQVDVEIDANTEDVLWLVKGFHWMLCYGDYRREVGYALKKVGVTWTDLTKSRRGITWADLAKNRLFPRPEKS